MIRPLFLLGAIALTVVRPVAGQVVQNPTPGSVIRFRHVSTAPWTRGHLIRLSGDSLWIRTPERELVESVSTIDAIQIRSGTRTRLKEGILVGLGIGLGTTALFLGAFCGGDTLCETDEFLRAGAIFTLPATLAGGLIGATIRVDRWRDLPGQRSPRPGTGLSLGVFLRP